MRPVKPLVLDGASLDLPAVERTARELLPVEVAPAALERIARCSDWVARRVDRSDLPPVYGLNTGFGYLRNRIIPAGEAARLSRNLIESHSAGVGAPLPREVVRAAVLLRANTLCHGVSGVRPETVRLLVEMLNRDITPVVPSKGSVGASGDLSPLSHIALALSRRSDSDDPGPPVLHKGELKPAAEAFALEGLERVVLGPKEGLALNNGMQVSAALLGLSLADAAVLMERALDALALSCEAMCAMSAPFDPVLHELRPHPGQARAAAEIRRRLQGSSLVDSRPQEVQDPYSLRCAPQVLGACMDVLETARGVVEIEFNSACDNPLLVPDSEGGYRPLSGGNFHGEPIGFAADSAKMAIAEMASIAERWCALHVDPGLSRGLPAFLARKPGLHSGLMIAQYTAAALVSENKVLAHPSTVDSIPTGAGYEDFVSMGSNAALHCYTVTANAASVIGIALFTAREALRQRMETDRSRHPSPWSRETVEKLDAIVPPFDEDRPIAGDFERILDYVLPRRSKV